MELKIIRGTTNRINLTVYDDNENVYILGVNEKIIFGVKQNPENTDYDIQKIITSIQKQGNSYMIDLMPGDTQNLQFGHYFFDVGLQTSDGNYYMVVPCSPFILQKAVTQKEVTS